MEKKEFIIFFTLREDIKHAEWCYSLDAETQDEAVREFREEYDPDLYAIIRVEEVV